MPTYDQMIQSKLDTLCGTPYIIWLNLELYYESKKGFLLIGGCFASSDFDNDTFIPFNLVSTKYG